jgi:hypothetical protein
MLLPPSEWRRGWPGAGRPGLPPRGAGGAGDGPAGPAAAAGGAHAAAAAPTAARPWPQGIDAAEPARLLRRAAAAARSASSSAVLGGGAAPCLCGVCPPGRAAAGAPTAGGGRPRSSAAAAPGEALATWARKSAWALTTSVCAWAAGANRQESRRPPRRVSSEEKAGPRAGAASAPGLRFCCAFAALQCKRAHDPRARPQTCWPRPSRDASTPMSRSSRLSARPLPALRALPALLLSQPPPRLRSRCPPGLRRRRASPCAGAARRRRPLLPPSGSPQRSSPEDSPRRAGLWSLQPPHPAAQQPPACGGDGAPAQYASGACSGPPHGPPPQPPPGDSVTAAPGLAVSSSGPWSRAAAAARDDATRSRLSAARSCAAATRSLSSSSCASSTAAAARSASARDAAAAAASAAAAARCASIPSRAARTFVGAVGAEGSVVYQAPSSYPTSQPGDGAGRSTRLPAPEAPPTPHLGARAVKVARDAVQAAAPLRQLRPVVLQLGASVLGGGGSGGGGGGGGGSGGGGGAA